MRKRGKLNYDCYLLNKAKFKKKSVKYKWECPQKQYAMGPIYRFCIIKLLPGVFIDRSLVITYITTSGVLEHKWRANLKLHYCKMIDFNF